VAGTFGGGVRTLSNVTRKTISLGARATDRALGYRYACNLARGTYRYYVYARDQAGNAQRRLLRRCRVAPGREGLFGERAVSRVTPAELPLEVHGEWVLSSARERSAPLEVQALSRSTAAQAPRCPVEHLVEAPHALPVERRSAASAAGQQLSSTWRAGALQSVG
jgi:hypothetical protein